MDQVEALLRLRQCTKQGSEGMVVVACLLTSTPQQGGLGLYTSLALWHCHDTRQA
jgi:hypothetical protein